MSGVEQSRSLHASGRRERKNKQVCPVSGGDGHEESRVPCGNGKQGTQGQWGPDR